MKWVGISFTEDDMRQLEKHRLKGESDREMLYRLTLSAVGHQWLESEKKWQSKQQ